MSLDKDTVARIARLARLKVPEEELEPLAGELSGILAWIEQLNEVDTANIEPLASVSDVTLPMRHDKVTDGGIADKVLANAPGGAVYIDPNDRHAGGFFTVPKVVE
jgi:aspartyl-tRNA(Asn)/glutamyl-tRNA(Gln) amidotransferase subunit C